MKYRVIIFHPALAPYRVDQFNSLSDLFDLKVVFIFDNVWNHKFDQSKLLKQLRFEYSFLLVGPNYKGRVLRFGMLKQIREFRPDVVFGYEYSFTTQYLILLKQLGLISQKIGSMIDDNLEMCIEPKSRWKNTLRNYSLKSLDYIVLLSESVASYYENTLHLDRTKIIVSPILQDSGKLRVNVELILSKAKEYFLKYSLHDKKLVLFVGRLIKEKGLPAFLDNISEVLKKEKNILLVIVGEGEERRRIEEVVQAHEVSEKVILPGRFEGVDLLAWYVCSNGFVLPSTFEPFGAVINESLVFGLRVLSSKYVGSTFLLGNEDVIFDPMDAQDTKSKFRKFTYLLESRSRPAEDLLPSRMTFDFEKTCDEWNKIYD